MTRLFPLAVCVLALGACFDDPDNTITNPRDERIEWVYETGQGVYYGSPATSLDGQTVYLGTSEPATAFVPRQNYLHAVTVATGARLWTFGLGLSEVRSSPAVGPDGSISFIAEERNASGGFVKTELVRVSSAGALVWRTELGAAANRVDEGFSAPAVASDGSVYVATDSLYAISNTGQIRWTRFHNGEDLRASPVVGADGTVYFAAHNIPLTAMHPDSGRVLWERPLGANEHVHASPAIGSDGAIYVATDECKLFATASDGSSLWTYDVGAGGSGCDIRSSPAIAADGTIIFGTSNRLPRPVLFAIRPEGTLRWTYNPSGLPVDVAAASFDIYSSPAIGSDGTVYFGHEYGRIYAVDVVTGSERWVVRTDTDKGIAWSSPALTVNGVLLINDLEGNLHAVRTESIGLQGTAEWPRYRGTNRSAGRR